MKNLLNILFCFIIVQLHAQKTQSYDEITVSGLSKEEIVFKDSKFYVTDFSVSEQGKFVLVNRFKKNYVYLLNNSHEKISELELDFKPFKLFEDCLGGIHVIGNEKAIQIWNDSINNIQFSEIPKFLYDEFYYKCAGASEGFVYFSHYSNYNQELLYYGIEKNTQYRKNIYKISSFDQGKNLSEEHSEIKGAITTKRMGEINLKELGSMRKKMDRYFYFVNVLTKPVYHPLISNQDTSFIFDHVNGKAIKIDTCGELVESIKIDYHKNRNWQKQVLFDSKKQKFYSVIGTGGNKDLMELSKNFQQGNTFEFIRNQAINKITIYDGYAYYLGKDEHGDILNKLYRIKVRT